MTRRRALWYRCEDRGRPGDSRMRWHYDACELCAAAARLLDERGVLAVMRERRGVAS